MSTLCQKLCGPFHTISSYKSPGRWTLFPSALRLRSRDSERLTDSSKVSKQTIGWAGIWEWPCPAPKYLVPSTEKNCRCFISQHTLGIIIGTRSWQTWAYFQLLLLHLIPTSTYIRGVPACSCSLQRKWGRKWFMSSFLQSRWSLLEKKVLCRGQEINGATPKNQMVQSCKYHENKSRKSPTRVY